MYQPATAELDCEVCPAGKFCQTNTSLPEECPAYHYCPQGSVAPTVCPDGTYTQDSVRDLQADSDCEFCIVGQWNFFGAKYC